MSSIGNVISQFFSDKCITRAECDDYARLHFGGPVKVIQPQGRFSYTVAANNDKLIIQFRDKSSPLQDTKVSELLPQTHGDLVAPSSIIGALGDLQNGLNVYKMSKLPGVNYSSVAEQLADNSVATVVFIKSLAIFFAQAWMQGQRDRLSDQDRSRLAAACQARLEGLSNSLPKHLLPIADHVRKNFDYLFNGSYPIVLTHGDLSEMNLLVDEGSGVLTGVVDWPEASFLPFGFALYALDSVLGDMYKDGWTYRDNADEMRNCFWNTFNTFAKPSSTERKSIKVARLAGILFRYGTPVNSTFSGMLGVRGAGDVSMAFLEAFVSSEMRIQKGLDMNSINVLS